MDRYQDKIEDASIKADVQRELTIEDFTPQEFIQQCLAFGEKRGYRDKWSEFTYKARYGNFPDQATIEAALDIEAPIESVFVTWLHELWRQQNQKPSKPVGGKTPDQTAAWLRVHLDDKYLRKVIKALERKMEKER